MGAAVAGLIVFLPATSGAVEVWSTQVLGLGALVLLVGLALPRLLTPGDVPPLGRTGRRVAIAIGLFLAFAALQTVTLPEGWLGFLRPRQARLFEELGVGEGPGTLSFQPFHTRLGLVQLGAAAVAFAIGAFWARRRRRVHALLVAYLAVASVVALFGVLQALSGDTLPLYRFDAPSDGRARGPFVNPNHFAGYLEMAVPVAVSYLLFSGAILPSRRPPDPAGAAPSARAGRVALLLLAVALIFTGLVESLSRMGILVVSVLILGLSRPLLKFSKRRLLGA